MRVDMDEHGRHYAEAGELRVTWDAAYGYDSSSMDGVAVTNSEAIAIVGAVAWDALSVAAYDAHCLHCREHERDYYEERE